MALRAMHNVGIVVEDLEGAIAFFRELGLEVEGRMLVEGKWVDQVIGLEDASSDIVMMRTPDGQGRLELTKFHRPAAIRVERNDAPNALGIRRIMFEVEGLDAVIAKLRALGGELVGEVAQYKDVYRLCYMRAPEGFLIGIAEAMG
jgi:catechol 2,3-dioxygenase-like lactoylglutathione lyase family enzyme